MAKAKGKAGYMISAVAEQYEIHPQTLRLYEREGLLLRPGVKGTRGSIPMRTWSAWK